MAWESGSSEQQRLRAGFAVLSVGVFILLFAWILSVLRTPESAGETAVHEKLEPPSPDQVMPILSTGMLLIGALLLLVLVVSLFALVRISRHYRQSISRRPSKPSLTADVWKMHKIPQDAEGPLSDEPPAQE